ncbi:MAG TPA: subtype I-C CRISPR-associated endonuclease Cas1 [Armatimonadetes bacterium]|nr:subtype I-C CRISPR-associated endonuclease Cas1 [Armatimonadota bacterium]
MTTSVLLNTLYVGTEGAYVCLENDQVRVEVEGQKRLQVPLHHLGSIVLIGRVAISMPLIARCAEDGRSVVLMTEHGRFQARVLGKTTGNVLLRKCQYDFHADEGRSLEFARTIVAAKIQNSRQVLLRARRDAKPETQPVFSEAIHVLEQELAKVPIARTLDEIRGCEGRAAQAYFDVFDPMITTQRADFRFDGRSRRPPRDRTNAILSFLYTLWTNDCVAALEGVGLDPQFGILHTLRPGRPGLALDLVEEFRAIILDRLCLTLINRRQVQAEDVQPREGGSVLLTDQGRKKVLVAYQERKKDLATHPMLKQKIPIGLLPHVQARLMARAFRGDIPCYAPYQP